MGFDFDAFDEGALQLGSTRKPTQWVVTASPAPSKQGKQKKRGAAKKAAKAAQQLQLQQAAAAAAAGSSEGSPRQHAGGSSSPGGSSGSGKLWSKQELQQCSHAARVASLHADPDRLMMKKEPRDSTLACIKQEDDEGNVEYKLRIKDPNPVRLQQLITQMKFRLSEGAGECFYYIGVEDDGYPKGLESKDLDSSIATLNTMARSLRATAQLMRYLPGAYGRMCALLRVTANCADDISYADVRVAVSGSVDSGKSTLVAVLTHGSNGRPLLDNSRGLARMNVLRHKHEIMSGRTSSISMQVLGYDHDGRVINYAGVSTPTPAEISASAASVLTFIDMGGHRKYLKTALFGLTCLLPDYALVAVSATSAQQQDQGHGPSPATGAGSGSAPASRSLSGSVTPRCGSLEACGAQGTVAGGSMLGLLAGGGLCPVSRQHLAAAIALEVPVALVLTKVDQVCESRLASLVASIRLLVASLLPALHPGREQAVCLERLAPLVTTEEEAAACAQALCQAHRVGPYSSCNELLIPMFPVSSVTGAGLPVLHAFLSKLQPRAQLVAAAAEAAATDAANAANTTFPNGTPASACGLQQAGVVPVGGLPDESEHADMEVHHQGDHHGSASGMAAAGRGCLVSPLQGCGSAADGSAAPVHFQVEQTFEVDGVGSVVSGTLVTGVIEVGQQLMLGPTQAGGFLPVIVTCIQRTHISVRQVKAGQAATVALQPSCDVALGVATTATTAATATVTDAMQHAGSISSGAEGRASTAPHKVPDANDAKLRGQRPQVTVDAVAGAVAGEDAQQPGCQQQQQQQQQQQSVEPHGLDLDLAKLDFDLDNVDGDDDDDACGFTFDDLPSGKAAGKQQHTPKRVGAGAAQAAAAAGHCNNGSGSRAAGAADLQRNESASSNGSGGGHGGLSSRSSSGAMDGDGELSASSCSLHSSGSRGGGGRNPTRQADRLAHAVQPQLQQAERNGTSHVGLPRQQRLGPRDPPDDRGCRTTPQQHSSCAAGNASHAAAAHATSDPGAGACVCYCVTPADIVSLQPSGHQPSMHHVFTSPNLTTTAASTADQPPAAAGQGAQRLLAAAKPTAAPALDDGNEVAGAEAWGTTAADGDGVHGSGHMHMRGAASVCTAQASMQELVDMGLDLDPVASVPPAHVSTARTTAPHRQQTGERKCNRPPRPQQQQQQQQQHQQQQGTSRSARAQARRKAAAAAAAAAASGLPPLQSGASALSGNGSSGGATNPWSCVQLATSPPNPIFVPCSPPNSRKGAVLLDAAIQHQTTWQFEAALVLLGGHWPPRGLLSGCWPPVAGEGVALPPEAGGSPGCAGGSGSASDAGPPYGSSFEAAALWLPSLGAPGAAGGVVAAAGLDGRPVVRVGSATETAAALTAPISGGDAFGELPRSSISACSANVGRRGVSSKLRKASKRGLAEHMVVVHCGSVRQTAKVVAMQEICGGLGRDGADADVVSADALKYANALLVHGDVKLTGSMRAAAALLNAGGYGHAGAFHSGGGDDDADGVGGEAAQRGVGCLVVVHLQFASRPEWLREGARLVVRDRADGSIAGAGYVRRVLLQHTAAV